MKKELKGFLVGVLITSTVMVGVPTFAKSISESISVSLNTAKIALNGKTISLDNLNYEGSTYVNLVKICDLLGKSTSWDSGTKTINIIDKITNDTKDSSKPDTSKPDASKPDENKPEASEPETIKPATDIESLTLKVLSANSLSGGTTVEVTFSEVVDKASAEEISSYAFSYGKETVIPISSAKLDSTATKVTLTTAEYKPNRVYTLVISNVKDTKGNIMPKYLKHLIGNK